MRNDTTWFFLPMVPRILHISCRHHGPGRYLLPGTCWMLIGYINYTGQRRNRSKHPQQQNVPLMVQLESQKVEHIDKSMSICVQFMGRRWITICAWRALHALLEGVGCCVEGSATVSFFHNKHIKKNEPGIVPRRAVS